MIENLYKRTIVNFFENKKTHNKLHLNSNGLKHTLKNNIHIFLKDLEKQIGEKVFFSFRECEKQGNNKKQSEFEINIAYKCRCKIYAALDNESNLIFTLVNF